MYIFNRITVNPQLPKRINRLNEIANNLWWAWNTEFLRLLKTMDGDLWEKCDKNPVKFLKHISQEKLEEAENNAQFVKDYDKIVENFDSYMASRNTWFAQKYPENKNDLIAYFSAEYGLDQTIAIYSGGLGILSGDHLKSASDLGIPLVAVGLMYKNGYFHQRIDKDGIQHPEYKDLNLADLPIHPVKDKDGNDFITYVKFPARRIYLKVWQINVGRIKLYLLDSDIDINAEEDRGTTAKLYGGDQEMRIRQEIILGMGGVNTLKKLGLTPTVYHMNEGHSAFLNLELIKNTIRDKQVSFDIARDIASSKTVFTTHTPVPAGNDIFPIELVEKYFKDFWPRLGLTREEFLKLGMKPCDNLEQGFNMGILALKIAGKKNGVSKLHGEVSRELFSDVWKKIDTIPDDKLWEVHMERKQKLINVIKQNLINRLRREGVSYDAIGEALANLHPDTLMIGFARRFATYKRATLIFKDLERITQILNNTDKPVVLVFAGKAHPADRYGADLIKQIHEVSMMPQFKGKIFILENYSIEISRYLVSGVDVWLNNPRRPMEASGTSGQKASVNGVVNFSVLDGWWAEGYNQKNGWTIGTNAEYPSYEEQDIADSQSMYYTLENKIIPAYYAKDENGISKKWMQYMKNSIMSTGGKYSTARMVVDYTNQLYIPLCNLTKKYYTNLESVTEYSVWKKDITTNWKDVQIEQIEGNADNITLDAGNQIEVKCVVTLPNIDVRHIEAQVYYGKFLDDGSVQDVKIIPMKLDGKDDENKKYYYSAKIDLISGGNYGYSFRVMPKHEMLLESANLDLIKWVEK